MSFSLQWSLFGVSFSEITSLPLYVNLLQLFIVSLCIMCLFRSVTECFFAVCQNVNVSVQPLSLLSLRILPGFIGLCFSFGSFCTTATLFCLSIPFARIFLSVDFHILISHSFLFLSQTLFLCLNFSSAMGHQKRDEDEDSNNKREPSTSWGKSIPYFHY